jgi:hypothetical protein
VAAAIHVIVCTSRFVDGSRKITHVSEVLPLDDRGDYQVQDLFVFTQTGRDEEGRVMGYLAPTGVLPTFMHKLIADGFTEFDEYYFDPSTYGVDPPPMFAGEASVGPAAQGGAAGGSYEGCGEGEVYEAGVEAPAGGVFGGDAEGFATQGFDADAQDFDPEDTDPGAVDGTPDSEQLL